LPYGKEFLIAIKRYLLWLLPGYLQKKEQKRRGYYRMHLMWKANRGKMHGTGSGTRLNNPKGFIIRKDFIGTHHRCKYSLTIIEKRLLKGR